MDATDANDTPFGSLTLEHMSRPLELARSTWMNAVRLPLILVGSVFQCPTFICSPDWNQIIVFEKNLAISGPINRLLGMQTFVFGKACSACKSPTQRKSIRKPGKVITLSLNLCQLHTCMFGVSGLS